MMRQAAGAALIGASLSLYGCGGGGTTSLAPSSLPDSTTDAPSSALSPLPISSTDTPNPAAGSLPDSTTNAPSTSFSSLPDSTTSAPSTTSSSPDLTTTAPSSGHSTDLDTTTLAPSPVTSTTASPVEPGNPVEIARWMNALYTGFNPDDDTSPLGVTIMMHHEFVVYCGMGCYEGEADCRTSSSVYNHLVQVTNEGNNIAITMDRLSGVVFNQSVVQGSLTKCSYMFDGATFSRLNGGCGCGALGHSCDDTNCAYNNIDPDTGVTVTGNSAHVQTCSCDAGDLHPDKTTDQQCFWKGPSFYRPDGAHEDETRKMLMQRLEHQTGTEQRSPTEIIQKSEFWNEVILDGNVLLEQLALDAARVIPAFVYKKGSTGGRMTAQTMASKFASDYGLASPPPLIAIDTNVDVSQHAPFSYEAQEVFAVSV